MFRLTRNLIIFALISIVLGISFHWTLSHLISIETYGWIWPMALAYALLMFFNGLICGRYDDMFKTRGDLGFSYHTMSFLTTVPIWMGFAWSRPEVSVDGKFSETLGVAIWGVFLLVHMFFSRRSLKGYTRKEVFD